MKTRNARTAILFLILALFCTSCSRPEPATTSSNAQSTVPLFDDLGSYHYPVTTSNPTAQQYFDQGLRLMYGFNHDEAERAFREAARLDPNCAMAWWGVAFSLGPNYNLALDEPRNQRALDAVQKAQSLMSGASERERAYITAIVTRYAPGAIADRANLDIAFSNAMKELSARYPDDLDAAVLYAESLMDLRPWQLWTSDGKPQEGTEQILTTLESVLARNPDHPGANHYYIHAIEASPNPDRGAASAERLRTLVPGAGHLVHMPAHIYIRTGNYQGAIDANADAARVDEAYLARTNAQGVYPMMYYTHNFMFLSAAAGMAGQAQRAIDSAAKAVAIAAPMAGHEPMVEYVLPWSLYAFARSRKWDDILAYPRPAESTPSTLALWHYARTIANLGKGNVEQARAERREFDATRAKVPQDLMLNTNKASELLTIAAAVMDARLASTSGDRNTAIRHWMRAIEIQDRLVYDEPPAWYYPIRESLGAEYLRARRFADAERTFRRDLEINRNNARSLFGLRETLRSQSKNSDDVNRQFEEAWKNSEVQLTVDSL